MEFASSVCIEQTRNGVARIEVRAFRGRTPESPLTVSLARYAPDTLPPAEHDPSLLNNHLMAVDCRPHVNNDTTFSRASQSSAAVSAFVDTDEAPDLVIDRLLSGLPATSAAGAIIDARTCRVGLRTRGTEWPPDDAGRLVTMTSLVEGAPIALFPAALLGWSSWWQREAKQRGGRVVTAAELPPPPAQLVLQDDGNFYLIQITGWARTAWPEPPT